MNSLLLTTILSCYQINGLIERVTESNLVSNIQKNEIIKEFLQVNLACKINNKNKLNYEYFTKFSNGKESRIWI